MKVDERGKSDRHSLKKRMKVEEEVRRVIDIL